MSESMRPLLFSLLAADIILKGISLYKSARKEQKVWFVALLLINSLGVLPLIYLLIQNSAEGKQEVRVTPKKVVKAVIKPKKRR